MKYTLVATAILCQNNKYLIAKRSMDEEKFPGFWTVPGGTIDEEDHTTPNEDGLMYDIIEKALEREIMEEVGLTYTNLRYVISLAYPKKSGFAMCLSFAADVKVGEEVKLNDELTAFRWVTLEELDKYQLVTGIKDEIEAVAKVKSRE